MNEQPSAGIDTFALPVSFVGPDGKKHSIMTVKEMTGRDDDLLAAQGVPWSLKIMQIIKNCTSAVGEIDGTDNAALTAAIKGLTNHDRLLAMIRIRMLTHGPRYEMTLTCNGCKRDHEMFVDLGEFVVPWAKSGDGTGPDPAETAAVDATGAFIVHLSGGRIVRGAYLTWDA